MSKKPKYVNGPNTAVFEKGEVLYGLDLARAEVRKSGRAVLVEGQLDAVALHLFAGLPGAVGLQGSQLTPAQAARLVAEGCRDAVLVPDPDGKLDLARALEIGLEARLPLRLAQLPACKGCGKWDPDTVARAPFGPWGDVPGAQWLAELVADAPGLWPVLLARLDARRLDATALTAAIARELAPLLAAAPPAERELMAAEAGERLGLGDGKARRKLGVRAFRRAAGLLAEGGKKPKAERPLSLPPEPGAPGAPPAAGQPERCTDRGNALRLVRHHGADLLWCEEEDVWYLWDGRRWAKDRTGAVHHRADATIDALWREASGAVNGHRYELCEWAEKSEDGRRIREMIRLARHHLPVVPEELDTDPWLLCVQNGVIDLKTSALRPHRRDDRISKLCPVPYEPQARAPLWLRCLHRWMDDDVEMIGFLQRAAGYSLTGLVGEHCFFLCHGDGRNGKSTFLDTLRGILGEHACGLRIEVLLAQDRVQVGPSPDIARLKGRRLVVSTEPDEGVRLAEGLVKALTGGEDISARFLHRDTMDFSATHKLWLGVNHLPQIRGQDEGIWSKIRKVPWDVVIPPAERDPELKAKLRAEWPGILAWAVDGAEIYRREGLRPPEKVLAATREYSHEQDVVGRFLEECTETSTSAWCLASALYEAYEEWAKGNEVVLSQAKFGRVLTRKGMRKGRSAVGGKTTYEGLGLKT
jgi:putative DNA primase/helicase